MVYQQTLRKMRIEIADAQAEVSMAQTRLLAAASSPLTLHVVDERKTAFETARANETRALLAYYTAMAKKVVA